MYSASSQGAVALMVIEVFISASGMPSNRARMSPRWQIGTPTLPTSPLRQRVVAVVAGLGRQIEGDGEAGLAPWPDWCGRARWIGGRRRMAGIGAEESRACRDVQCMVCAFARHTRLRHQPDHGRIAGKIAGRPSDGRLRSYIPGDAPG